MNDNEEYQDITQVGIGGLKGLKGLNQQPDESNNIIDMNAMRSYFMPYGNTPQGVSEVYTPVGQDYIGEEAYQSGYGQSVYDDSVVFESQLQNLNEVRAQEQSGLTQLANGLLKFGTTAATTFLDSTLGTLYGVGTYLLTDKNFEQSMWDNDFNIAMQNAQQAMEDIAPNYYSQEELNSPWYTNIFTPNFIGDKVLKNAGFTVGALGAAALTGSVGNGAVNSVARFIAGATKAAGAGFRTVGNVLKGSRATGQIVNYITNSVIAANGEAAIEAYNAVKDEKDLLQRNLDTRYQELLSELNPLSPTYQSDKQSLDNAYTQYMQQASKELIDAGNSVYGLNMAILSISNSLEFASILKGGFNQTAKLTDYALRSGGKEVGAQDFVRGILRGEKSEVTNEINRSLGRKALITAKNVITEGSEEAAQNLASTTNQMRTSARMNVWGEDNIPSLLGNRINPEVTDDLVEYSKAFNKALNDNFGTPESKGWEEFFLGALTGGMGFISLRNSRVQDAQGNYVVDPQTGKIKTRIRPTWEGGFVQANREVEQEYEANQRMVDAINAKLADEEFIKRTRHAVSTLNASEEQRAALEADDILKFKNSEIGQLIEDVFFFQDHGMIDQYKDIFKSMQNIDDKTLSQIYIANTDNNGETPLSKEEIEKVRAEYQDKAKSNLEKIEMIQNYYTAAEETFRDRSSDFKEEMAFKYALLDDTKSRIKKLEDKKQQLINQHGETSALSNLDEKDVQDLQRLRKQNDTLEKQIKDYTQNPEKLELELLGVQMLAEERKEVMDADKMTQQIRAAKSTNEFASIVQKMLRHREYSNFESVLTKALENASQEVQEYAQEYTLMSTVYQLANESIDKTFNKETGDAVKELLYNLISGAEYNFDKVNQTLTEIARNLTPESLANLVSQNNLSTLLDNFESVKDFLDTTLSRMISQYGDQFTLWKQETAKRAKKKATTGSGSTTSSSSKGKGKGKKSSNVKDEIKDTKYLKKLLDSAPEYFEDKGAATFLIKKHGAETIENCIVRIAEITGNSDFESKDLKDIIAYLADLDENTPRAKTFKQAKNPIKRASWQAYQEVINGENPETISKPKEEKKEEKKSEKKEWGSNPLEKQIFNDIAQSLYGDVEPTESQAYEILGNIKKTQNLINENKIIPTSLKIFYDAIEKYSGSTPEVKETKSTTNTITNNLEGNVVSPFDSKAPIGQILSKNPESLIPFYGSVSNARKVQSTIDNSLRFMLSYINKDRRIRFIVSTPANENLKNKGVMTAIKYDDTVKRYVSKDSGYIINTQDGEYLVLGYLGYSSSTGNSEQFKDIWDAVTDEAKSVVTPFYVSSTYKTVITEISDGNMIDSRDDSSSSPINVLDFISGKYSDVNPNQYDSSELKWGIVYPDGMHTMHFKGGESPYSQTPLVLTGDSSDLGKVYLYVPTANGKFYRTIIEAIHYNDMVKTSKLYDRLANAIKNVVKNRTQSSVMEIKGILAFNDKFYISYDNDEITIIYNNSRGELTTRKISTESELENIIADINPRVNVSFSDLETKEGIEELAEAGALNVRSLANLGTMFASFKVALNPDKVSSPVRRNSTPVTRRNRITVVMKGVPYVLEDDVWRTQKGEVVNKVNSDILNEILTIERDVKPEILYDRRGKRITGTYYFKDNNNVFYKNEAGNWSKLGSTEIKQALKNRKNATTAEKKINDNIKNEDAKNDENLLESEDLLQSLQGKASWDNVAKLALKTIVSKYDNNLWSQDVSDIMEKRAQSWSKEETETIISFITGLEQTPTEYIQNVLGEVYDDSDDAIVDIGSNPTTIVKQSMTFGLPFGNAYFKQSSKLSIFTAKTEGVKGEITIPESSLDIIKQENIPADVLQIQGNVRLSNAKYMRVLESGEIQRVSTSEGEAWKVIKPIVIEVSDTSFDVKPGEIHLDDSEKNSTFANMISDSGSERDYLMEIIDALNDESLDSVNDIMIKLKSLGVSFMEVKDDDSFNKLIENIKGCKIK